MGSIKSFILFLDKTLIDQAEQDFSREDLPIATVIKEFTNKFKKKFYKFTWIPGNGLNLIMANREVYLQRMTFSRYNDKQCLVYLGEEVILESYKPKDVQPVKAYGPIPVQRRMAAP